MYSLGVNPLKTIINNRKSAIIRYVGIKSNK